MEEIIEPLAVRGVKWIKKLKGFNFLVAQLLPLFIVIPLHPSLCPVTSLPTLAFCKPSNRQEGREGTCLSLDSYKEK